MQSIWTQTTVKQDRKSLDDNIHTEVAVIGAGMAGVLIASFLQEQGVKTVVLEANYVGSGQTQNTTAKITSQHALIYDRLLQNLGKDKAKQYASANQQAITQYTRLITQKEIACEFQICPSYLYSTTNDALLKKEALAAKLLGINASYVTQTHLPFDVTGAVRFEEQAIFNPLLFLQAMAKDLTIYEHTPVLKAGNHSLITPKGSVMANYIVFACHYPFINKPGYYFLRLSQERSYVIALKNASSLDGAYLGIDPNGLSFRKSKDLLLLGGGKHRCGVNYDGGKYDILRTQAKRYFPNSEEVAHWSAQDCISLDGVPFIGQFSGITPNWYVATGFNKWGMTSSMVAAMLISNYITGEQNPYGEVFAPNRFHVGSSVKQLGINSVYAIKGLTKGLFMAPKPHIVDQEAILLTRKCPHLGCALEWNPDECSWDCPCHGSRFDYKGKLIDNPAKEDISYETVSR